ncbi:relaxase/mobilization nuclease domain protein, partial [Escherichia coli FRIK2001]
MSIAGLREEPAQDWLSLHKRLASDGLYITMQEGELVVKDGWDRAREGVALSSFGPLWTAEKLGRKLNRPGFPGECFICELRLPDHRFRWKHN